MPRYYSPWLVAFLIRHVYCAEPNPPQKSIDALQLPSSKDMYRPQSQVIPIEHYRFLVDKSDDGPPVSNGAPIHDPTPPELQDDQRELSKQSATVRARIRRVIRFDHVDRLIFRTALPLSTVFAIIPVVSALDLFWVNRLGDTLAVAGQAAANQVYNSAFWLFAFLPTITATLVSKSHSSGDIEKTQDAVCQAMLFSLLIAIPGGMLMFFKPSRALGSILKAGSPALETARPYLKLRAFSFAPMMISFVGFSTFRGTMEVASAVKITMATSLLSAILDPLLIHVLGFGVRGSALAGLGAEYTTAAIYLKLLLDRNLLRLDKLTKLPAWGSVAPLIKGSVALQIRSFALNLTQLAAARVIQSIDDAGVAPAAHALALQTFQLGGILFGALGMATQTLVPSALANLEGRKEIKEAPIVHVKTLVNRLLCWGLSLGLLVSIIQFSFLPGILKSSPLAEVRDAARLPTLISISMQALNAIVSIGEGTMMGYGGFVWMSVNIVTASIGYVTTLQFLPQKFGLAGVWMCMATFTAIRMVGSISFLFTKMRLGPQTASHPQ